MMEKYILVDGKPVLEPDLHKWMDWFGRIENRVIEQTKIQGWKVSTVFLGLNNNFSDDGDPLLYETMVFNDIGEGMDNSQLRFATLGEAKRYHAAAINKIRVKMWGGRNV